MAYVFVTCDVKVTATITVENSIKQILRWIVLTKEGQSNSIYDDPTNSFDDIRMFTEKDTSDLSTDFYRRTHANVNVHFGTCRTTQMKELLH